VSLGRLLLAWLPVAALFVVAPPIGDRWDMWVGKGYFIWSYSRWVAGWRLVEAAVVVLFASLWFDTLGAGGWWLLFFLVGLLVAFPRRLAVWQSVEPPRRRALLVHAGLDVVRYVAAGGLLAWRLG
jgi:hypothetical protein